MAFENKVVASEVASATLWANLLQFYEYMESSKFSSEREWRIVNPDPHYSLAGQRTEQTIQQASPPQGWATVMNTVRVKPADIKAFVCPYVELNAFRNALPPEFTDIQVVSTET